MPQSAPTVTKVETPTFAFDEAKLNAKVKELEDYYKPFSGKVGYNPHFFLYKLSGLVTEARTSKTKEAFDAVMSLEKKEPVAPGCSPIVLPTAK